MLTIDTKDLQDMGVEVASDANERTRQALIDAIDDGWGIWLIQGPKALYEGMKARTLPMDWPLIITENYRQLWRGGILPQLASLTLWQQAMAAWQQSQADPKNPTPFQFQPEFMWGLWIDKLPDWLFDRLQGKFIALVKQQVEAAA